MILGGRLCEQSAIAVEKEPVGDGVFWLFSEPVRWGGFYYLTQLTNFHGFTTLQTHAMITISSENFFSPNTSIAVRLSSRVSISETKSDMKNNKY